MKSFTIYYEMIRLIRRIEPIEKRDKFIGQIIDFYFFDKKPNLEPDSYEEDIWENISKPIISYKSKVINGQKGGRPKKEKETENETENETEIITESKTENESKTKSESETTTVVNVNVNVYVNNLLNEYKNIKNNELIKNKILDWFEYKKEREDKYTEKGIKLLIAKIDKLLDLYDTNTILNLIDYSISNNFKGIIWDKLKNQTKYQAQAQMPNWFGQKIETEQASIEEQEELKNMLSEFGEVKHEKSL